MAVREYGTRSTRWRQGGVQFGPFEGGLNLRDAYIAVAPNELTVGLNLTLDENGVAVKRNGSPSSAAFPAPPSTVSSSYYSVALARGIIQTSNGNVYKAALGAGSWTLFDSAIPVPAQFADFAGKLVYTAGSAVGTYDGTTVVYGGSGAINGTTLAVWQNKVWLAGMLTGSTRARIYWSNAGDALTWTSTDFVDVREKDDEPIIGLFASSGLLVFKEQSWYRINDSTTGSFTTVDWNSGALSSKAITTAEGNIYYWGRDAIYATNGTSPGVSISDKVRPLFQSTFINSTTKPLIAATATNNRVYFFFSRGSSSTNDEILEYNPRQGWFMEADALGAPAAPFKYLNASGIEIVSFFLASTTNDLYTSSTRSGYQFSLQTGWVEPFGALPSRIKSLDLTIQPAATTYGITLSYLTLGGTGVGNPSWAATPTFATGFQTRSYNPNVQGRAYQMQITDTNSSANFRIFNVRLNALLTKLQAA